jgi:hypothetical protein
VQKEISTDYQVTNFVSDKRFRLLDIGQRDLERNVMVNVGREISGVVFPIIMELLSTV